LKRENLDNQGINEMKMTRTIRGIAIYASALAFVAAAGVTIKAQQYNYIPPASVSSPGLSAPTYTPPSYTTPSYAPPSYYTPSYYNASCKAEAFSLETDEAVLKDMFQNKKCIYLAYDEVPNFDAYHISDCYYKHYGVSCSTVNEDCKYVDTTMLECSKYDGSCEVISEYWNRPVKMITSPDGKTTDYLPITFASIDTARDVIVEYADQQHTSTKPVKDRYTFRHNDKEMWWREIYYLCTQGNVADRTQYFNKRKLISSEECPDENCGINHWIRGEVGHECRCEARLGYYYYQGEKEHEAEWTLPEECPERWREYNSGATPESGSALERWRLR